MNIFRDNQKIDNKTWVNTIRNNFDCDTENAKLSPFEFILLIFAIWGKEIIEGIIATIDSLTSNGHKTLSSLFQIYPFNSNITWLFLLKILVGIWVMMFLQLKYNKTAICNLIWSLFCFGSIYSSLDDFSKDNAILKDFLGGIKLLILFGFIIYFFSIDSVHLDSLKLLIYSNVQIDPISNRVYLTAYSKLDPKKIIHVVLWCGYVIFVSMFSVFIISKIFSSISGSSQDKPTNQNQLEQHAKKGGHALASVIISVIFIAPLIEEWIFRRTIMKICDWNAWSILASAFIFGLVHLQGKDGFQHLIPYCIPGLIFATSMWISRNIWHVIFSHCFYNMISVVYMLIKLKSS